MPSCSILQCKNDSNRKNIRNGGVSYHRFPKVATIKEKWIDATGRINWMPTKSSTICSDHFLEDDYFITGKGYRYLKSSVFPTLKILKYISQDQNLNDATVGTFEGPDLRRSKIRPLQKESVSIHPNTTSYDIKSEQFHTASGLSTASSLNKKKIDKQLKFCKEKMEKQDVKIKQLHSKNVRLENQINKLETVLAGLEEKFGITRDDLNCFISTYVEILHL